MHMDTEAGIVMNTDEQTNFMDILQKKQQAVTALGF
jgi:hypothetical protein